MQRRTFMKKKRNHINRKISVCFGVFCFLCWTFGNLVRAEEDVGQKTVSENNASVSMGNASRNISIRFPTSLDFVIDPWELKGKGQIFSQEYMIQNCDTEAILVKITDLKCVPEIKGSIQILSALEDNWNETADKKIVLTVNFDNGDSIVLSEEVQDYSIILEPEEKLIFSFSGFVNENVSEEWKKEDLKVSCTYSWGLVQTQTIDVSGNQAQEDVP